MCDIPTENLIDFNIEETSSTDYETKPFASDQAALIPSPCLSLENNPFDLVQKLAVCTRPDDPFDIVEKEATLKARQICSNSIEVKLGNLLSLSEDSETNVPSATDSNVFHTAEDHELENESPPITLSSNWSPCTSTASCESSDSNKEQACGIKTRKTRNHRNRLLKLSISNAAFSTPNSSRPTMDRECGLRNELIEKLVCLPGNNEESSIDSESPVKLIDEDLKLENSNKKQSYTEKDYEHDLEMMEIPILKQLQSPNKLNNKKEPIESGSVIEKLNTDFSKSKQLPDLETLRQKLRAKRLESNSSTNISDLINDFKSLITESKMIDEHNKHEVEGLLESLTSTLFGAKSSTEKSQETSPQPIKRQGTFDLELQDEHHTTEHHATTTDLIGQPAAFERMSDVMLKSSGTYDGETTEDKAHLNLPQIDPPSPEHKQPLDANFQGIMEQLQHFLEQQHLSTELSDASQANGASTATGSNPTFIVVMPTMATNSIGEESYDSGYSYRRRSQSLSLHDKLKIVQLPIKTTPGIQVTEPYESPPLNTQLPDFKTPSRFLERSNSFSSATPFTPSRLSRFNQSVVCKDRASSAVRATTPTQTTKFGLRNESRQPAPLQRPTLGIKPDLKKKVRTTNSLLKSNAPLKATLPFKQVAPNVQNSGQSVASASNTSMHLVARAGHMSHTSTPMPAPRLNGLRQLNKVSPTFPTASNGAAKSNTNSMRLSNIATTPIGKTLSATAISAANLRRRTISEFKAKSPNKPRASLSNIKSNLNRPLYSAAKHTMRPSLGGNTAHPAIKNKENKQPNN